MVRNLREVFANTSVLTYHGNPAPIDSWCASWPHPPKLGRAKKLKIPALFVILAVRVLFSEAA